jgi:hypothetical protein
MLWNTFLKDFAMLCRFGLLARSRNALLLLSTVALVGLAVAAVGWPARADDRAGGERVFELRTYITHEGRLDALNRRFRDDTTRVFAKHGMTIIGFWTPTEGDDAGNKLVYILAFPSREAAKAAWKAFAEDPEWIKAKEESERDGKIVKKVISEFLRPTDYSPLK